MFPFVSNVNFYIPWKHQKIWLFPNIFKEYRNIGVSLATLLVAAWCLLSVSCEQIPVQSQQWRPWNNVFRRASIFIVGYEHVCGNVVAFCKIFRVTVHWCSMKQVLTVNRLARLNNIPSCGSSIFILILFFAFVIIWVNSSQIAWAGQHSKFRTGRSQMLDVQVTRKDSIVGVFLWIWNFFQNPSFFSEHLFMEHFRAVASASCTFFLLKWGILRLGG